MGKLDQLLLTSSSYKEWKPTASRHGANNVGFVAKRWTNQSQTAGVALGQVGVNERCVAGMVMLSSNPGMTWSR